MIHHFKITPMKTITIDGQEYDLVPVSKQEKIKNEYPKILSFKNINTGRLVTLRLGGFYLSEDIITSTSGVSLENCLAAE